MSWARMTISSRKISSFNRSRGPPVSTLEVLNHHLDHRDAVFLGRVAALPQPLSWRSPKTRRAAELIRQLLEEPVEPFLADGRPSPVSFGRRICTRCEELMRL